MNVLFLHNNYPGQFRHLAPALAAEGANQVVFGTQKRDAHALAGVTRAFYTPARQPGPDTHFYVRSTEEAVLTGQAVVRMAASLARKGFTPDVVVAHSGWGPSIFIKEVFPRAKLLTHIEWFYRSSGSNLGYAPGEPYDEDVRLRVRVGNVPFLLDLVECDWAVSPTEFQRSQIPEAFARRVSVLHEGVDTAYFTPGPPPGQVGLDLPNLRLPAGTELVTYATRGMEPYRGFPQFIRAIGLLLKARPHTHVVVAGEDRVAYGAALPPGESWKQRLEAEVELDPERVHFVGGLPYAQYKKVLQASSAHVYLTIPFVLSWSMLEAMSCGVLLVGSATPPVQEMVEHGRNGVLVEFFDHEQLAARLHHILDNPGLYQHLRAAARATIVDRYDLAALLPRQVRLVNDIAAGRRPS